MSASSSCGHCSFLVAEVSGLSAAGNRDKCGYITCNDVHSMHTSLRACCQQGYMSGALSATNAANTVSMLAVTCHLDVRRGDTCCTG
jgi:hypothetical protein